ncbi:GNAT family N-acetyltransferase [Roseateles oligotrophus]|uniref:GNAT family N-acetyltransferase n=1 Tax=Roseateles oligotrophus TaxID=1769250 RepID=A0ABT2YGC7_9BURK|nr:GNAT family N-acetyltransferase [Roseateles oligotrophus]MCV2369095.1 GNAT family N-acetyltransferase [Roseateles oligotrophus]
MGLRWSCAPLAELSPLALYQSLALRSQVFVLEQACVYLDPDGVDLLAWHLLGHDEASGELLASARLLPPLAKGPGHLLPEIGRVVSSPAARGSGAGRALMQRALLECERLWPGQTVAINAQSYLLNFYAGLGFVPTSEPYDEDGILHIDMERPPAA